MTIHRCFFSGSTVIVIIMFLAGCVSGGGVVPKADRQLTLPAAPLPLRVAGDRTYYTNGRKERVMSVIDGRATIRRSSTLSYGINRDQLFIQSFRVSKKAQTQSRIAKVNGKLWPLQVGNEIDFILKKSTQDRATGEFNDTSERYWACKVDSAEQLSVVAGTFDVFRVNCARSTARRNFRQRSYFYYSPQLDQTILRLDFFLYGKTKRIELSAFAPAVASLPVKSKRRYEAVFKKILTNVKSGESAVWRSKNNGTAITVTPVKTFKDKDGQYCRNYRTRIRSSNQTRMGAGLVCRTSSGEWKIPRRVASHGMQGKGG